VDKSSTCRVAQRFEEAHRLLAASLASLITSPKEIAQKGDARKLPAPTIRQVYCGPLKETIMKLRVLRAAYALAALVAFVVAAGAGSKFH
jgi:hypothetical protein